MKATAAAAPHEDPPEASPNGEVVATDPLLSGDEPRHRQQRPAHDGSAADRQGQPEWLEPAAHELRQDCDRAGGERREDSHPRQAASSRREGPRRWTPSRASARNAST